MTSFTKSSSSYQIRNAQESDPKDETYNISDNNTNISTNTPFKKLTKKDKFKFKKENQLNYIFKPPNAYIIKENLFSYKLLDINFNTPQRVVFYCTMPKCSIK